MMSIVKRGKRVKRPERKAVGLSAAVRPHNSEGVDVYQRKSRYWISARSVLAVAFLAATVTATSVAEAANRAPTISGTPPATAREGLAYSFIPRAYDADGDTLTFSIANLPVWAKFNRATGALTGTPGPGTVGNYTNIRIGVSDGKATVLLPIFSIAVQQSSMGSATLHWQPPTTRTDGSPLTNLDGYRIRFGTAIGSYPNLINVTNEGLTSVVVSDLPPATYYFVVSAYDTKGAESAYDGSASKKIN